MAKKMPIIALTDTLRTLGRRTLAAGMAMAAWGDAGKVYNDLAMAASVAVARSRRRYMDKQAKAARLSRRRRLPRNHPGPAAARKSARRHGQFPK